MKSSTVMFLGAAIYIAPHASPATSIALGIGLTFVGLVFYVRGN